MAALIGFSALSGWRLEAESSTLISVALLKLLASGSLVSAPEAAVASASWPAEMGEGSSSNCGSGGAGVLSAGNFR